jgi:hypothetical protein
MHMMILAALAVGVLAAAPLAAQTTAPAPNRDAPSNPAVASPGANNPGAPAAGANSFTEGQAKARLEKEGYTSVTSLMKDGNGIWRGQATKGGQSVNVTVDYQGNIVVR